MAKPTVQQEPTIEFAPMRRGNRRSTAITKGERKMLRIERKKLLGIMIKTHIAEAGFGSMGQLQRKMVEEFADSLDHNEEIWHAAQGKEFAPYLKTFLKGVIEQNGGALQTLYEVACDGIVDIADGPIVVDESESWLDRFFGGG